METSRDDPHSRWNTSLKLENPWEGAPVFLRERTSSTMDDARGLALSGCPPGTVVVAGFQERGRGRGPGRSWYSSPWESLMATLVLDVRALDFPVALLPFRAAVGVCRAIEEHGVRPRIKWPNDLLVSGRKISGILCETFGSSALVGFGVNCMQKRFPHDLAAVACSMLQASGSEVNPLSLLPRVLARMKEALGDEHWREALLERLASPEDLARVEAAAAGEITTA